MTPRQKRFAWIASGLAALVLVAGLLLYALNSNIVFFYTPTQVSQGEAPDGEHQIAVSYVGTLPDLFREGKGVVAQGRLDDAGHFTASEVLAKHDENYMPPEAAEALHKAGHPSSIDTLKAQ